MLSVGILKVSSKGLRKMADAVDFLSRSGELTVDCYAEDLYQQAPCERTIKLKVPQGLDFIEIGNAF